MLSLQSTFLSLWHTSPSDSSPQHSLTKPLTYADRFRIRLPGDAKFTLGPHVDGGGVERWEDPIYRSCYSMIFEGKWREYDPFDVGGRVREGLRMNMYECAGGCSMFRAWQGWVSDIHSRIPFYRGIRHDYLLRGGSYRCLPLDLRKERFAFSHLRKHQQHTGFFDHSSLPPQHLPHSSTQPGNQHHPLPSSTVQHPVEAKKCLTPFIHISNLIIQSSVSQESSLAMLSCGRVISFMRTRDYVVPYWGMLIVRSRVEGVHSGRSDSSVMCKLSTLLDSMYTFLHILFPDIPAAPDIPMNRAYVLQQRYGLQSRT